MVGLRLPRRSPTFPVWAYVAEWADNPGGPSWRGRCADCPVDLPVRQVSARRIDLDVLAAAFAPEPSGPIYEAMRAAETDLRRHLSHRHGIVVGPRPRSKMRINLQRPD